MVAVALTLAGFAVATPSTLADDAAIRFLKPKNRATVIGSTEIRLFVDLPDGVTAEQVEVRVDGRLIAILEESPWILDWTAGDGSKGHTLDAVVRTSDGKSARTTIRTSALRVNQIEAVDLVNLYLVVRDAASRYVTGLQKDDFRIVEDGVNQTIERFAATDKPLRVAVVLDASRSMIDAEKLEKAKRAALEFLDILEDGDEGVVVQFADSVYKAQELTSDKALLAEAIEDATAGGGTALYDAIWRTARDLDNFDGRRVMVLLSDGQDESESGLEPGSLHTLEEALDQVLRHEVMVFPIGLGRNLDEKPVRRWNPQGLSTLDSSVTLASILERFADNTGGRAVFSTNASRLKKAFSEIAADLRNQYTLAYSSTNPNANGKWRTIRVETPGRDVEVVTRKGYYAPKPNRFRSSQNR
jgi:VWFA-related protein